MVRMFKSLYTMLCGVALLGLPALGMADALTPTIPEAQAKFSDAQGCVEPTDEMRKNHMEYILHQRDETMHKGIRTRQYALEECINCHVPENTQVRHDNPAHFCSSCHTYAAVKIDCFQCHADRPVTQTGFNPLGHAEDHHGGKLVEQPALAEDILEVLAAQGETE